MGRFKKGHKTNLGKKRKPFSEEHRRNMRISHKGAGMTGKHHSKESIEKMKKAHQGKHPAGKDHPQWKGGRKKGQRRYVAKNKDKVAFWHKQERLRKRRASGSHTFGEWEKLKAQYNWTCPCCKKSEPKIRLTEDHIIPLKRGGSDNIENIQPLCQNCNSKKHLKTIVYRKGGE